ncbi:hypothetical protein X474_22625 [Dethiosulfatarculus sandiegensis]|uniref:Uncharacterized protein n=1 Tax=Dethiosulfatarculus sandiegensis TaxID=1429043 RepID=A0A0D2GA45_9BACT|nr:hypothetical protein X474_22625 [Dethiosulfatarculus sandiegensis]
MQWHFRFFKPTEGLIVRAKTGVVRGGQGADWFKEKNKPFLDRFREKGFSC